MVITPKLLFVISGCDVFRSQSGRGVKQEKYANRKVWSGIEQNRIVRLEGTDLRDHPDYLQIVWAVQQAMFFQFRPSKQSSSQAALTSEVAVLS